VDDLDDPDVTTDDIDLYVDAWGRHIAWDGVRPQLRAMLDGMSDCMDLRTAGMLQPQEMVRTLCGTSTVAWTEEELEAHVQARPPYF